MANFQTAIAHVKPVCANGMISVHGIVQNNISNVTKYYDVCKIKLNSLNWTKMFSSNDK